MAHLLLLLVCVLSIEVSIRLNLLLLFDSVIKVTKKVIYVISKDNISDHWKEKIIPAYALRIMAYSLQLLLIFFLILSLFLFAYLFFNDFLKLAVSIFGILESIIFAFMYINLRKIFVK